MKPILVEVKSTQRDLAGEDTVIELVSPGKYYEKNNAKYIIYDESEVTGMDGVRTTIKLLPEEIYLIRNGKVNARNEYKLGQTNEAVYHTPLGDLHMAVKTHEMAINVTEGCGTVHLGYDISIEGEWMFYNQLDIKLREDNEVWK